MSGGWGLAEPLQALDRRFREGLHGFFAVVRVIGPPLDVLAFLVLPRAQLAAAGLAPVLVTPNAERVALALSWLGVRAILPVELLGVRVRFRRPICHLVIRNRLGLCHPFSPSPVPSSGRCNLLLITPRGLSTPGPSPQLPPGRVPLPALIAHRKGRAGGGDVVRHSSHHRELVSEAPCGDLSVPWMGPAPAFSPPAAGCAPGGLWDGGAKRGSLYVAARCLGSRLSIWGWCLELRRIFSVQAKPLISNDVVRFRSYFSSS